MPSLNTLQAAGHVSVDIVNRSARFGTRTAPISIQSVRTGPVMMVFPNEPAVGDKYGLFFAAVSKRDVIYMYFMYSSTRQMVRLHITSR